MQSENIVCPRCDSAAVKFGTRKLKREIIQRYRCKKCNKVFTDRKLKQKSYPSRIILNTISTYNLGYTLEQTEKRIAKRFHIRIPESTIYSWVKEYSKICAFNRLREQAVKFYNQLENMILSQKLQHNQFYNFKLHKAKLELQAKELPEQKFQLLKAYLEKIPTQSFPHNIFRQKSGELEQRASQLKIETLRFVKLSKQNFANILACLGLQLAKTNKERHEAVQNFMIINDSVTVAVEVPIYLTQNDIKYFQSRGFKLNFENYRAPITGHIDILQIRNGLIHILDFKPETEKVQPVDQLTIYALALASRTKLAVKDFKCAWFDDRNYFEFFPLHAVYAK